MYSVYSVHIVYSEHCTVYTVYTLYTVNSVHYSLQQVVAMTSEYIANLPLGLSHITAHCTHCAYCTAHCTYCAYCTANYPHCAYCTAHCTYCIYRTLQCTYCTYKPTLLALVKRCCYTSLGANEALSHFLVLLCLAKISISLYFCLIAVGQKSAVCVCLCPKGGTL